MIALRISRPLIGSILLLAAVSCTNNSSRTSSAITSVQPDTTLQSLNEIVLEPEVCNDYIDNVILPLKFCDSGSKVTRIQEALRALGYKLESDGYFGNGTKLAVREFQTSVGLQATGQIGSQTWTKLIDGITQSTSSTTYLLATELVCASGASIYACKARFSNGAILRVDFPNAGQSNQGSKLVDREDVIDDYGNTYCVSLFSNGKGTFKGGNCAGSASPPIGNSPAGARAIGIDCPDSTINTCQVTWSNGNVTWILGYLGSSAPISATTTMYEINGSRVCVSLHEDGKIKTRYC